MSLPDSKCFVTLEKYKSDLSCFKSKNDFILSKIENFLVKEGFCLSLTETELLKSVVELLKKPADFFCF